MNSLKNRIKSQGDEEHQMIYTLKQIETPRLIIRPVQLGDEIPLNEAINNSLEILQKWQSWAKDPSIDVTRGFIQRGAFVWKSKSIVDFPMVVIHKVDQKIIGASGYNDRSDIEHGLYEIGYWCDADYQGQGLVTEYTNALTRYAFEVLKAAKVVIMMQLKNKKSIAVAERLGFTNEGIKDRDPLDCISDHPVKNTIYSVRNADNLPALKASWTHNTEENTDAQIIAWAKETLEITDIKSFASSRVIISTPWSMVLEINTGNTLVYLKHTPEMLALEASIIQVLHDQFNIGVPEIIVHNNELNCFLMKDAGKTLRVILKQKFDVELFCKVINNFTAMQLAVADDVSTFIDMGVPDWRLAKLPGLYMQLLSQKEMLMADGLSEKEIRELEKLLPTVSGLCQQLSSYGIKESIVQPDFNDNNSLIADPSQDITIIDLGEIAITHPFFSLTNCLYQAKRHHGLTEQDSDYHDLITACLHSFQTAVSKQESFDALALATGLSHVYQALAHHRLMLACDKTHLHSLYGHGKLSQPLKEFITVCKQINKQ